MRIAGSKPFAAGTRAVWIYFIARWFVGLVLVATGTGKALDMEGFSHILAAYDLLPAPGNVIVAHTLPFIELAIGFCLLTRVFLSHAAWVAVGLHLVLLSATLVTLGRGISIANCGCFGVFLARPLTGQTVVEDAVLLGMSLLVLWDARCGSSQGGLRPQTNADFAMRDTE